MRLSIERGTPLDDWRRKTFSDIKMDFKGVKAAKIPVWLPNQNKMKPLPIATRLMNTPDLAMKIDATFDANQS